MLVHTVPLVAESQSMWVNRDERGGFALEYLRPDFEGGTDFTLLSGIYVMSFRTRVSDRFQLVGELPFVHVSYNDSFVGDQSSTDIGNPYFAVASGSPDSGTMVEVGVHAPLSDESPGGLLLGVFGDFDRQEMYVPELAAIGVRIDHMSPWSSGVAFRVRLGTTLTFPTGDFGDENDLSFVYGAAGVAGSPKTNFSLGLTGRWIASEDGGFGDNSIHQATFAVSHRLSAAQIGAQIRIPVDDQLDSILNHVFGLSITLPFR